MSDMTLNWIDSGGGPLILLARDCLASWRGHDEVQIGPTDYERACETKGFLSLLCLNGVEALVFREIASTAWIPSHSDDEGTIIQWVYANDEASILRANSLIPGAATCQSPVKFVSQYEDYVLFDPAYSGCEYELCPFQSIRLSQGVYTIRSYEICPDASTSAVLHYFALQEPGDNGQFY